MCILDNASDASNVDFLCDSSHSVISIEQPGHGAYVIIVVRKWTYDSRLLKKSNLAFQQFDLPTMSILGNTIQRMIVALFSQVLLTSCRAHNTFKEIFNSMHGKIDTTLLN